MSCYVTFSRVMECRVNMLWNITSDISPHQCHVRRQLCVTLNYVPLCHVIEVIVCHTVGRSVTGCHVRRLLRGMCHIILFYGLLYHILYELYYLV